MLGAPVTSQYCSHLGRSKSDIASRFFDPDHMDRLRYIPVPANSDSNRAGLPIGFTEDDVCYSAPSEVDPHPEVRFAPDGDEVHQGIAGKWLGLNCAACHTAQIDYAGKQYLIEGAPAMGEFEALMDGLVMAMEQTLSDPKRYSRFASKVLEKYAEAASPGEHECVLVPEKSKDADALKADLGTIVEERKTLEFAQQRWFVDLRFWPPGCLQFDTQRSKVASGGASAPTEVADAPVSYPFIWEAPHHDYIQWNGKVRNDPTGALGRNVGEVLGVFGRFTIMPGSNAEPRIRSTVRIPNLGKLETLLRTLWSPQWTPEKVYYDKRHCLKRSHTAKNCSMAKRRRNSSARVATFRSPVRPHPGGFDRMPFRSK